MKPQFENGRSNSLKQWINARAQLFLALLLVAAAPLAAPAAPVADSEEFAQLLDQLGVRAVLDQAPAVLAAAVEAELKWRREAPLPANWRGDLEAQCKPQRLLQSVARHVQERYRADGFRQAQQRLQEPIAKRARYFDLAMMQPGAEKNLRAFLLQQQTGSAEAADGERRALARDIDTASASSLLMATLQSAIAARVQLAVGSDAVDAALLHAAIAERQRYLAPLATDYLLYDYRYLRDDELREYRDLLRDEAVQQLLDASREALLAALVGELMPPPAPMQSP